MAKKKMEDRDVFPGEKLAVIEVLQDGQGTYQEDGDVRSAELGRAHYDLKDRRVKVNKKTRDLVLPSEGLDVMAEVGSVMRRDARVDIFRIDGKTVTKPWAGEIHINSVEREFSRDMAIAIKNSDIIKAKIINTKNKMNQLSIRGPEYGVIYGYCTRCGTLLELQRGRLNCPKCDRSERRKIASTYGKEELV
jgi:exosome complex component CSL4